MQSKNESIKPIAAFRPETVEATVLQSTFDRDYINS